MAAARAVTLTVVIGPLETVSEGVLDSRNVRVSIPAPGGPSAFSVWRGVGNVVSYPATLFVIDACGTRRVHVLL